MSSFRSQETSRQARQLPSGVWHVARGEAKLPELTKSRGLPGGDSSTHFANKLLTCFRAPPINLEDVAPTSGIPTATVGTPKLLHS